MLTAGCRAMRLERAICGPGSPPAIVVINDAAHAPDSLVGVSGLNLPRMAHESAGDYLRRVHRHVMRTRGAVLPFVGLAEYPGDE